MWRHAEGPDEPETVCSPARFQESQVLHSQNRELKEVRLLRQNSGLGLRLRVHGFEVWCFEVQGLVERFGL